jgi:hypothetical protein
MLTESGGPGSRTAEVAVVRPDVVSASRRMVTSTPMYPVSGDEDLHSSLLPIHQTTNCDNGMPSAKPQARRIDPRRLRTVEGLGPEPRAAGW